MSTSMKKVLSQARKVMHPNSRKSIAISKKTKKISNREKLKLGNAMKQNLVGEKMLWIQENMVPDVCPYTPELTADLLQKYISRNDEELEQIAIRHSIGVRKNRQHASREDVILMTKKREETEYETCGIEIPDILNPAQCALLRKWDGELRYLPNFKFVRFGKKNLLKSNQNKSKPPGKSTSKPNENSKKSTKPKVITNIEHDISSVKNSEIQDCPMDAE
ncbi:translation machinery-associated protein 16 homolog [Athalia rosae]|uniref:translation machinery-associated protein 16 homolog n=1 Tax=Athalia rosae TaxID=37344 RepID=UPI002033C726|nr:translation machinery-associated protein 16 homolog [Athalia rosae]